MVLVPERLRNPIQQYGRLIFDRGEHQSLTVSNRVLGDLQGQRCLSRPRSSSDKNRRALDKSATSQQCIQGCETRAKVLWSLESCLGRRINRLSGGPWLQFPACDDS